MLLQPELARTVPLLLDKTSEGLATASESLLRNCLAGARDRSALQGTRLEAVSFPSSRNVDVTENPTAAHLSTANRGKLPAASSRPELSLRRSHCEKTHSMFRQ